MGESPKVMALEDDVAEIKSDVKGISSQITELRVLVAGGYVTKKEFEEYKKEEAIVRRQWATSIIAITGIISGLISAYVKFK